MHAIIDWIVETVGRLGYIGIFLLMALESSFFPFPSEVVMIPAGYLAYKGEMNLSMVILMGILGSAAGALFNYYLALTLGRQFLLRFGRYVFFGPESLERMEGFFRKHGEIATFNGRLIPGVRQYISLPAGLARMNPARFVLYTSLGAGLWVTVLAMLGYLIGSQEHLIRERLRELTLAAIALVVVTSLVYYFVRKRRSQ